MGFLCFLVVTSIVLAALSVLIARGLIQQTHGVTYLVCAAATAPTDPWYIDMNVPSAVPTNRFVQISGWDAHPVIRETLVKVTVGNAALAKFRMQFPVDASYGVSLASMPLAIASPAQAVWQLSRNATQFLDPDFVVSNPLCSRGVVAIVISADRAEEEASLWGDVLARATPDQTLTLTF